MLMWLDFHGILVKKLVYALQEDAGFVKWENAYTLSKWTVNIYSVDKYVIPRGFLFWLPGHCYYISFNKLD